MSVRPSEVSLLVQAACNPALEEAVEIAVEARCRVLQMAKALRRVGIRRAAIRAKRLRDRLKVRDDGVELVALRHVAKYDPAMVPQTRCVVDVVAFAAP